MDGPKFRVMNPVREGILPIEVAVLDSVSVPLKKLLESIVHQENLGLWLNPYRGIPWSPGLPKRDLVFLDENYCVLREPESFPCLEIEPFRKTEPFSALVLPTHTIFAAHIRSGDQLTFHPAEESEGETERVGESSEAPTYVPTMLASAGTAPQVSLAIPLQADAPTQFSRHEYADEDNETAMSDKEIRRDLFKDRLLRLFSHQAHDRRRSKRYHLPGLVAVQQNSDEPKSYLIGNVSDTGIFLLTDERIALGTRIFFKLERKSGSFGDSAATIDSETRVVRWGPDGVGVEFLPYSSKPAKILKTLTAAG